MRAATTKAFTSTGTAEGVSGCRRLIIDDIIDYTEGVTESDIDEDYIKALITLALKNGAESRPQGGGGGDRGGAGGDDEGCGGYGK